MADRDIWNDNDGEETPKRRHWLRSFLLFFLTLVVVLGVVLVLVAVTLIIAARPLTDLFCRKVVGGRKRASHL